MVSYVDTTVTLNAITTPPNAYQHLQPHGRKVWVAISNGPQGPLTLSAFSEKGAGEPAVIIDAGQPFMGQIDYYILTVSGVAGQVFNVKIQDEPFQPGKKQHVSASGATVQQLAAALALVGSVFGLYLPCWIQGEDSSNRRDREPPGRPSRSISEMGSAERIGWAAQHRIHRKCFGDSCRWLFPIWSER